MAEKRIRTLVVDDSIFMRTMLKNALAGDPNIEVVGSAQNGQEALKKIAELKPDVMTLDIEMPGVNGLQVLERIMKESPFPVGHGVHQDAGGGRDDLPGVGAWRGRLRRQAASR